MNSILDLVTAARKASENAYSPYSGISVGCAVLTDVGVFTGANVENSSYSLTICAERVAIYKAVTNRAKKFSAIAISSKEVLPYPCGACLQVMAEFCTDDFLIIIDGPGMSEHTTLGTLLPKRFRIRE